MTDGDVPLTGRPAMIAYADCPAGASGDMILSAFIDLGLPLDYLQKELNGLDLHGYELESLSIQKQGITARTFTVRFEHQHHHRHWHDIKKLISDSGLSASIKTTAISIFERLAQAEGRIHGVPPEKVHFHEVGAIDSIVDIVGTAVAWDYFHIDELHASPLPLGSGFIHTAHGRLPLPAPATLALLDGVPTYGTDLESEMVTPTGAAILSTLAAGFGIRPPMMIRATGYGSGDRDLEDRPNILRLTLGNRPSTESQSHLVVGETNIDDMNPEIYPFLMDLLLDSGALDVWLTPIQMKKGRPAVQLSFLAQPYDLDRLSGLLLAESTTLGVRTYRVDRTVLVREQKEIDSPWGPVQVKVIHRRDRVEVAPEYEVCRKIALSHGLVLRDVYDHLKRLAESG